MEEGDKALEAIVNTPGVEIVYCMDATPIFIGVLTHGMVGGHHSVFIAVELPERKQVIIAQTSLKLFLGAANHFHKTYIESETKVSEGKKIEVTKERR